MKNTISRTVLAAATLLVAGTALADQPVRVRTEGLPTHMRERIEAAAQQGPVALRQYLERTRMMGYQLRVEDIADVDNVSVVAKAKVKKEEKVAAR